MTAETRSTLVGYGMDVERTLARFVGNEALMMSFLQELPFDENMQAVKAARDAGDEATFRNAVHALKGAMGNLGLTPLFAASSALMDAIRAGDRPKIDALYHDLLLHYDEAVVMVKSLDA